MVSVHLGQANARLHYSRAFSWNKPTVEDYWAGFCASATM